MENLNLTCLFVHFNAGMRIDPYVITYIESLSDIGFEILFISNSAVLPEYKDLFFSRVKKGSIFERENKGADFGAWKWAIENNIIPENCDYLLLTNDSIFGPLFPLKPLFETMQSKTGIDFWGLTDNYQGEWHLQSYFICLPKYVFTSEAFKKVFKVNFSQLNKFEIIKRGEIQLTQSLLKAGFKAKAYVPYEQIDPGFEVWDAKNVTHFFWDSLITKYHFPFVKKELILQNPENLTSVANLFPLIEQTSSYPIEDIKQAISDYLDIFNKPNAIPDKISVLCHLYYPGTIYYFLSKLLSLKSSNTQFVFNLSGTLYNDAFFREMLCKYFSTAIVLFTPNQGRDIGGKLAAIDALMKCDISSNYSLVIHDKLSPHSSTGAVWRDKLLKIIDPKVLQDIFEIFNSNKNTGIITTKDLIQNEYDYDNERFRCTSNNNLWNYIKKYNLNVQDYNFAAGTIFWIRTGILCNFFSSNSPLSVRKEFEKGNALDFTKGTNIHAWERLFSFITHSQGFKTTGI